MALPVVPVGVVRAGGRRKAIESHRPTRFMFTVLRANRKVRESEHQEPVEFYRPSCNGTGV